jgi:hypothetical protein
VGDLKVYGVNVPDYAFQAFSYDAQSRAARWTLAPSLGGNAVGTDKLLLDLDGDSTGVTGTGPSALEFLDGEWADNAGAYPNGRGGARLTRNGSERSIAVRPGATAAQHTEHRRSACQRALATAIPTA